MAQPWVRDAATGSAAWVIALRGLRELAGTPRIVLYDVPAAEAPRPLRDGSIYLHGSPAWHRYLALRQRLDDGDLTLMVSLRTLDEREQLLAVDWGCSYANAFLYVEPRLPDCDLTAPDAPMRTALEQAAEALPATADAAAIAGSELAERLRGCFGTWVYWTGPRGQRESHRVPLALTAPGETLFERIRRHLPVRFPRRAFYHALVALYAEERELFSGTTARARTPFRTRLGLPLLHNPRYVDEALRRLVNEGVIDVFGYDRDGFVRFGAGRPIPDQMTDAEFEQLIL